MPDRPHQGVQQGLTLVVEDADLDDLIFRWMQARGFQVEVDGLSLTRRTGIAGFLAGSCLAPRTGSAGFLAGSALARRTGSAGFLAGSALARLNAVPKT
jgi:hypothetical protein